MDGILGVWKPENLTIKIKICTACHSHLPETVDHFYRQKQCRGGLDTACRKCRNEQRRAWKRRHSQRVAQRRRELYAAQNGQKEKDRELKRMERVPYRVTAQNLRNGIWERAKEHGYEVAPELRTTAFIEAWLRRQPNCECCGAAFRIGRKPEGQPRGDSASFDRFDEACGYTIENTALICWRCNNIKRNYHESDLRRVADWMERKRRNETGKFNE